MGNTDLRALIGSLLGVSIWALAVVGLYAIVDPMFYPPRDVIGLPCDVSVEAETVALAIDKQLRADIERNEFRTRALLCEASVDGGGR